MIEQPLVFISSASPDDETTRSLVARLRQAGLRAETSPRKTVGDEGTKWLAWYSGGLDRTVHEAKVCVIVVSEAWATSDWVVEEAETALRASERGDLNGFFYVLAPNVKLALIPESRRQYLRRELPREMNEAIRTVKSLVGDPSAA